MFNAVQGTVVDQAAEEKKKGMPMTVEMAKDVEVGQVGCEEKEPKIPIPTGMHAEPVHL